MPLTDFNDELSVTFKELEHVLQHDPYYGVTASVATECLIRDIYSDNADNVLFRQFKSRYSSFASFKSTPPQRELIYIWCGLLNLPTYVNDEMYDWNWDNIFKVETLDFSIKKNDLEAFSRNHSYPLPHALFPDEKDNTQYKVELEDDEFDQAIHEINTSLLEDKEQQLAILQNITINGTEDYDRYIYKVENLTAEIEDIKTELGISKPENESPTERKTRLHKWLKEEDLKLNGKRGSLKKTAEREGISRQALSEILNR